jgi:hypothetical protein
MSAGDRDESDEIAAFRRGREKLMNQIRESQETIERSKELIRQIDEMLTKAVVKPTKPPQP